MEESGKQVILSTVHGSHLYGLADQWSDKDRYTVYLSDNQRGSRDSINGLDDHKSQDLDTFLQHVAQGVPQALEALYSPVAEIDRQYAAFLRSVEPPFTKVRATYYGVAYKMAYENGEKSNPTPRDVIKLKRHALRLFINLRELREKGYFNPVLLPHETRWLDAVARGESEAYDHEFVRMLNEAQTAL